MFKPLPGQGGAPCLHRAIISRLGTFDRKQGREVALNQFALKAKRLETWDPFQGAQGAGQQQRSNTKQLCSSKPSLHLQTPRSAGISARFENRHKLCWCTEGLERGQPSLFMHQGMVEAEKKGPHKSIHCRRDLDPLPLPRAPLITRAAEQLHGQPGPSAHGWAEPLRSPGFRAAACRSRRVQASSYPDMLRFRFPFFPSYYGNRQI